MVYLNIIRFALLLKATPKNMVLILKKHLLMLLCLLQSMLKNSRSEYRQFCSQGYRIAVDFETAVTVVLAQIESDGPIWVKKPLCQKMNEPYCALLCGISLLLPAPAARCVPSSSYGCSVSLPFLLQTWCI